MSTLLDTLMRRIKISGPITVAEFMNECLMHPKYGYYQREKVFGTKGDFTTSPEISQMFGEMIGLWLVDQWKAIGCPPEFNLVECGPGRGTLMADILHAAANQTAFIKAASVVFVEKSKQLKSEQKKRVADALWIEDINALPDGPTLLVANEFFDALPIHQFQKHDGLWLERKIGIKDGKLNWSLSAPSAALSIMPESLNASENGSIVELCPTAMSTAGTIAAHIAKYSGAALIIDYGYDKSAVGDTFQAMKDHQYSYPLDNIGTSDLTAHVNFDMIADAARQKGVTIHGPVAQGPFLMSIGMGERAMGLSKDGETKEQEHILSALMRLTSPDQMGELFRVLALTSLEQTKVAGF